MLPSCMSTGVTSTLEQGSNTLNRAVNSFYIAATMQQAEEEEEETHASNDPKNTFTWSDPHTDFTSMSVVLSSYS